MTQKLIQELVGLAVEKELDFEYKLSWSMIFIDFKEHECYHHEIELDKRDTPAQLQSAIDKIKGL